MRNFNLLVTIVATGLMVTSGFAQDPQGDDKKAGMPHKAHDAMKGSDGGFVKHAAEGGMMEVEAAKVAAEKASNPDVKEFAEKLRNDHDEANKKLASIAETKNISIPSKLNPEHQKKVEELMQKNGADFDRTYVQMMIKDHPKDISLFERQAKTGKDPELKAFANDTLPTLRSHLKTAQDLQGKLGSTTSKR